MAAQATLVLRDIHQPPAPPWWPPAPGWWLVAALVVAAVIVWAVLELRRRRQRASHAAVFEDRVAAASTRPQQVAAMSELLRRATRQRDRDADALQGEAWLAWLDGDDPARPFTVGPGRLLLDGGFRPDIDADRLDALRPVARARFLQLLESREAGARRRLQEVRKAKARVLHSGSRPAIDAPRRPDRPIPVEPEASMSDKAAMSRTPAHDAGPAIDGAKPAFDAPPGVPVSARHAGSVTSESGRAIEDSPGPVAHRLPDDPAQR
jgi:hypothetical protein